MDSRRLPPLFAKATDGLNGSEIEQVFIEAFYQGFDDGGKEPTDLNICQVLADTTPLSKWMAEQITQLRTWAKGRARLATSQPSSQRKLRKMAA
jgi:hypothetical protein